jgi:MerR family transcriptional regulator, thiopeptide resistance regulator
MKGYTVRQLADMAGVSVRTLHHYDQIGLLTPGARTPAGYRLYSSTEALRLQQILFFRELGFALEEIQRILDDPGFDQIQALRSHRSLLEEHAGRITKLLTNIDRTIQHLTEGTMPLTDQELYEGFSEAQIKRYQKEAAERYDPKLVEESHQRLRRMSKPEWQALKAEGEAITRQLADLMDRPPQDAEVQKTIARHFGMIGKYYTVTKEIYRGLGQLYVEHDEFRAHYERVRPGLAVFMREAMAHYCDAPD